MRIAIGFIAITLLASSQTKSTEINIGSTKFEVSSFSIKDARSVGGGERGPALAVLTDNTVLLGGGLRGGSLYSWRQSDQKLKLLGNLIPTEERNRDARFAITDIAVLSQNNSAAELLVSYPKLVNNKCVEVVVYRVTLNRKTNSIVKQEQWFRSVPCVPISAVQHAAGRMEVIDSTSAYLTVGDLGYSEIDNRSKRGYLGSIFKISKSRVSKISSGHRNPQGIVLFDRQTLLASEHGPRGGDEINIIKTGSDYGWPFVTYGEPYSSGDYVKPKRTGVHDGYPKPITTWTPSIAPTELVQLPSKGYGRFNKGLVMGTLRQEALVFMRFSNQKIIERLEVPIGARIRDLDLLSDGRLIATTDDGQLLVID